MFAQSDLGQHELNGPFSKNNQLQSTSGVYVITTQNAEGTQIVIDAGESNDIRARISSHDRTQQWRENAIQGVFAWTHHCNEQTRMIVESAIRRAYNPVCGDR